MQEQKPSGKQSHEGQQIPLHLAGMGNRDAPHQLNSAVQGLCQSLFLCYPHSTQGSTQLQSYAPGPAPITCSVIHKEDEETA